MNSSDMSKSGEQLRGTPMTAEEYLAHVAYAYIASPRDTAEESIAKGLLEMACERLGVEPQAVVNHVIARLPGNRVIPPWENGSGAPLPVRALG